MNPGSASIAGPNPPRPGPPGPPGPPTNPRPPGPPGPPGPPFGSMAWYSAALKVSRIVQTFVLWNNSDDLAGAVAATAVPNVRVTAVSHRNGCNRRQRNAIVICL